MAKLSKKQGDNIAKLFNQMVVACNMLSNDNIHVKTKTGDDLKRYIDNWKADGCEALNALRVMGIFPVGFGCVLEG
jgi:hypothetical protein